jgi:putative oxidoreductase
MKNFLSKNSEIGNLVLRLGLGTAFLFVHGWGKIMQGPEMWAKIGTSMSNLGITQIPMFWGFMASAAEFGGGILLILGLFTRYASSFLAFTMVVAAIQHLSKLDPWNRIIYPIEMLSVMILLIFIGAGKYSLDNLLFKKK